MLFYKLTKTIYIHLQYAPAKEGAERLYEPEY